jgi:hypothetical protein
MGQSSSKEEDEIITVAEQGIQGIAGKDMKEWGEWTDADKQNFLTSIKTDEKFKTDVKDKLSTDESFRTMIATVAKGDNEFVKKLTELLLADTSFKTDVGKSVNDDVFKNTISTQVVQAYNSNDDFKSSVQTFLAGNAPFQSSVGTKVSSDSGFKVSIINDLKKDTVFTSSIKGAIGLTGQQGPIGLTGPQGPKGNDSTVAGPQGSVGPIGLTGPQGPKGNDSTVAGPQGSVGPIGLTGPQGGVGPQGPKGNDGTLPNDIRSRSIGRPTGDTDWFRLFGTPGVGTAVYHGFSLGEGGGLRVGDWRSVPAGEIQVTDRLLVDNRDILAELDYIKRNYVRKGGKYKLTERKFGRLLTNPGAILGVGDQNTQGNVEASWIIDDSPASFTNDFPDNQQIDNFNGVASRGKDGETFSTGCAWGGGYVTYGTPTKMYRKKLPLGQNSLVVDNKTMGGDPAPGETKTWAAQHSCV